MNNGQLKENECSVKDFSIQKTDTQTNFNIQTEEITCMLISASCCITTNSTSKTADTTLEAHCEISSGKFGCFGFMISRIIIYKGNVRGTLINI